MNAARAFAEVIGDPISHSKSPEIHRAWLNQVGIDADYRATRVAANELKDFLHQRRRDPDWRGCNVTAPLKELAVAHVDELSERAKAIGAINIITRRNGLLVGDNSDVDGIAAAVPGELVKDRSAILIGAGGAARAALNYLAMNGVAKVQLMARNPARAMAMAERLGPSCSIIVTGLESPRLVDPTVIINASPVGMTHALTPKKLAELVAGLKPGTLMFDMVYEPAETELLKTAKQVGLRTIGGLAMLIGQARKAFGLFYGVDAPMVPTLGQQFRDANPSARSSVSAKFAVNADPSA